MSSPFDVLVIGGGANGLCAAAYLARDGNRVIVAEALNKPGGLCNSVKLAEGFSAPLAPTLYALDPRMVKELRLARRGLKFAVRDMALVGLRGDGKHLVLGRDAHDAAHSIAVHSQGDAKAWKHFRRELFSLAREMRALWWDEGDFTPDRTKLEPFRRLSAAAWLDSWFESDALKATLAFDATAGGLSPFEPGSALALLWRASQEMCGLQGAVAALAGGPQSLTAALAEAAQAAGAEIRTGARVVKILAADGAVTGVELASGETIAARAVISTLAQRQTLEAVRPEASAGFAPSSAHPQTGSASVTLALDYFPDFGATPRNARFILAEKVEVYAAAHSAAASGSLPDEPAIEITIPSASDTGLAPPGQHVVCALVRPVPLVPDLKEQLATHVVAALNHMSPGLSKHVVAVEVSTHADISSRYGNETELSNIARMLANWNERVRTQISGLLVCAEPVPAISGRAGRIAAAMAAGKKKK